MAVRKSAGKKAIFFIFISVDLFQNFGLQPLTDECRQSIDFDRLIISMRCPPQNLTEKGTQMNLFQRISIILGALGVAVGAFGAHILKPVIESNGRMNTWETGMQYYWIHTLALLIVTLIIPTQTLLRWVVVIWLISITLFSGSLFALATGAPNFVGAITPLGGAGFIIGWVMLLKLKFDR